MHIQLRLFNPCIKSFISPDPPTFYIHYITIPNISLFSFGWQGAGKPRLHSIYSISVGQLPVSLPCILQWHPCKLPWLYWHSVRHACCEPLTPLLSSLIATGHLFRCLNFLRIENHFSGWSNFWNTLCETPCVSAKP